jgi:hypothetical protein
MKVPSVKPVTWAIVVKFKQNNGWSKAYTYTYPKEIMPDSLVAVPHPERLLGIARVKESIANYKFDPNINYKPVVSVLDVTYAEAVKYLE